MAQLQNTNQIQNQTQKKKYLVKLISAAATRLHIWDTERKQKIVIYEPQQYVLLEKLIDYLQTNGKKKIYKSYYRPKHFIYDNDAYELMMTPEEIMQLLVINKRNANSNTLAKIKQFLSQ